jgi:hypothetical protein
MLKKILILQLAAMVFAISCEKPCPNCPPTPTYLSVNGFYNHAYPITLPSQTVGNISLWEPESGWSGWALEPADNGNEYQFKTMQLFRPNYPNGTPYKATVSDLRVWVKDVRSGAVGRDITMNGTLLTTIVQDNDAEVALWRIDSAGNVYNANTTF